MRALRSLLLASALSLPCAVASAEPVSITIGLSSLIFNAAGGALSVGLASTIGGFIVSSAAIAGLQAAVSSLRGSPNMQESLGAGAVQDQAAQLRLTTRAGVIDRFMVIGEVLKSGNLFFEARKGPYLYRGYILAPHEIDGVSQVRQGTTVINLDANGFPVGAPYQAAGKYYLQVSIRTGTADQQMDPILATDFPELSRGFRARGLATAVVKMYRGADATEAAQVWGQNDPNFLFLIRGKKFFDPRDGTQVASNPSTFKFTKNAALCTAGWLTDADGGGVPWSRVHLDYLRSAADVCDQVVMRANGTAEPRYTACGIAATSTDPHTTLNDLKISMLGEFAFIDGKYAIFAGAPREAERTLTESSSRGGLDASTERAWTEHVNTVRSSFVAAERDYDVATAPVYRDEALLAQDGTEKSTTLELRFVPSSGQAQRICKYTIRRSQLGRILQRGEDIEAMRHIGTDIVRCEYTGGLSAISGTYEIVRLTEGDRMDEYQVQLAEYDGQFLFAWDPLTDERDWSQPKLSVN